MDPDQTAPLNRFEKFARILSRRHKQMAFSDAGFLGILRVNGKISHYFRIAPGKVVFCLPTKEY